MARVVGVARFFVERLAGLPIDIAERFLWEPSASVERIRIWLTDAP